MVLVKENREGLRQNKSESITKKYNKLVLNISHMDIETLCCCVFSCRPVELLLAVTGHFGWMCQRNASAWLYMSTNLSSLCLMPITLNEKWSLCSAHMINC